ncbi:helix-turn-helix domain containing protein [Streptomyces sp. ND04-05B]|uniref:helix-turn-helix domain-containing protein n=1 Tax=Streptomyces sp. ND04-05B TaxID=3028693 RepID=UPI0029ABC4F1|nr:helix-turn-helix domain-containing protein [Streptomyces sp. ND04-05B]MDX3063428.1 helix-turn-helix domain containing protein [Streptomyces sp. ND04-05B]
MTDEQQPDEPNAAEYRRADSAKMPTTPPGQEASIEAMVAAMGGTEATRIHNRRKLAERRAMENAEGTAMGRLQANLIAEFVRFEEERAAERRQWDASHGTALDTLAQGFRTARDTAARHDLAEQVGSSLPLAEAGVIRRVAKALEAAMPGVVVDARVDGWTAKEIAAELDLTPSYVYRILRDYPWEAAWSLYVMPDGWTSDDDDEPWERVTGGTEETAGETAEEVARRILDEQLDADLATKRVRVAVWRAGDGDDLAEARGDAEHEPAA